MNPNANLVEQRRIVASMTGEGAFDPSDAFKLAELSRALDEWLTRGGSLPEAWKTNRGYTR